MSAWGHFESTTLLWTSTVRASNRSVSVFIVAVSMVFCSTISNNSSVCLAATACLSSLAR